MGIAFSANLRSPVYELLTLVTYPWLFMRVKRKTIKQVYAILFTASVPGWFCLPCLQLDLLSLDFAQGNIYGSRPMVSLALSIIFFCYPDLVKAIMPLHSWLPSAMVAPTPSVLCCIAVVVKSGVFEF